MKWPWTRHEHESARRLEQAHEALDRARSSEPRTRRLAKATERAIVQNHFAHDIRKAMEGS